MNKKKLFFALRLAVSAGALLYLVTALDWQKVFTVFSRIRVEYIWFAPILLVVSLYCLSVRWCILLNYLKIKIGRKESFIYYLIGNFYNIILPSSIGGDAIRVGMLVAKTKQSIAVVSSSVLFERILGLLVVFLISSIGILLLSDDLQQQLGKTSIEVVFYLSLSSLIIFVSIYFLLQFIPLKSRTIDLERLKILKKAIEIVDRLRKIPIEALFRLFLCIFFAQALDIIASYYIAKSLSIDLPVILFFVIVPIVYISTALPISLGGLGVREGVFTLLLSRLDIIASDSITFSLVLYLNRILVAAIGGIVQCCLRPSRFNNIH